jgi:hypothetical protein
MKVLWIVGVLAVLLIAGYFIDGAVVHKKVDAAIAALPPWVRVSYASYHFDLFKRRVELGGVSLRLTRDDHEYTGMVEKVTTNGHHVEISGMKVSEEKMHLYVEGSVELDSVYEGGFKDVHLQLNKVRFAIPDADEQVQLRWVDLDSRERSLRVDTLRVLPLEGKAKHHQVDIWEATSEGLEVSGLDVMGLREQRLIADKITVRRNSVRVFRDRRLPLKPGEKELPMASLKAVPFEVRVGSVKLGTSTFAYKEQPKDGGEMGTLTIHRMTMSLQPLINHPVKGDPAYLTLRTEGSLMNSGTVVATTKMPLHKGEPYRVDGVFHELDVTKLNNPAENLGDLHLESGMLNQLDFHFEMDEERSTGLVTGRYHELVVDKLKKNGKVGKLKSFALKHLIIPKNKETAKGKVNYKRDPERYFSYYLLHSLLVGVKSSFTLGFLLPG